MLTDIFVPLVVIGLAEVGDKTQLSILALSMKTRNRLHLLIGAITGFLLVDGFAIAIGSEAAHVLQPTLLKTLSGILFIVFGILMIKEKKTGMEGRIGGEGSFLQGLTLTFIAEWGDKTQLASCLFSMKYNPIEVLTGAMASLTGVSALSIYLGKMISRKINRRIVKNIAAALFFRIGIYSLLI